MEQCTPGLLKGFEPFAEIPDDHLQWLIDHSECKMYEVGDHLFAPDWEPSEMFIVLSGRFSVSFTANGHTRNVGFVEPGNISGLLPYSRMKQMRATGAATEPSQVLITHRDQFRGLAQASEELMQVLVGVMTTRVREFTKQQQQNEKMMSLGKLSAGLAHELNNPASAVVRSAQELKKHLQYQPDGFKKVIEIRMEPEQVDAANKIIYDKVANPIPELSMMERSEREDDLAEWLEDHGAEDGYEMADVLADFGMTTDDLEEISLQVPDAHLTPVVGWIRNVLTTEKMVAEIEEASKRIADLVQSIKSYTHMDRAPEKEEADIHAGIKNTVVMLNHKLRKNKVTLVENFSPEMPPIKLFVSELNQVWTNLIDNAIDAMADGGTLEINSVAEDGFAKVRIVDSGTGIPEDIVGQIFDPFFTTKGVGEGTGMGLEIAHRIVQRQHNGRISVESKPGRTQFEVCIPID